MDLKIIGTSHIAKQSINEIKKAITEDKPDIVALELDLERASALLTEQRNKLSITTIFQLGVKGYLFAKIGQYAQQKLGKMVGVAPGSEMRTALLHAQKQNIEVAFIDQPIRITLKNFSKELTWKEKFHFIADIFKGIFFPKRQLKEYGLTKFDLSKVPEKKIIAQMVKQMKKRYPNIYKTLVADRNKYMINALIQLMRKNPHKKILAVVGAGHKEGMEKLLLKVDVVQ